MTKFCIDINTKNIACWWKYKETLAEKAIDFAAEKGVVIGNVVVTDNEALLGLYDCVENEGIFCWAILWDIIERTRHDKEGEK